MSGTTHNLNIVDNKCRYKNCSLKQKINSTPISKFKNQFQKQNLNSVPQLDSTANVFFELQYEQHPFNENTPNRYLVFFSPSDTIAVVVVLVVVVGRRYRDSHATESLSVDVDVWQSCFGRHRSHGRGA